jgi:hypothetical protein
MENERDTIEAPTVQQAETQPQIAPEIAAAIEAGTIQAATLDSIETMNEDGTARLTAEETIRVARTTEAMEQRVQGSQIGGFEMGEGMNIFEEILKFFGLSEGMSSLQEMTAGVFNAFGEGLITEAGTLNNGVLEPLMAEANRAAPAQQPAHQEPNNTTPAMQGIGL